MYNIYNFRGQKYDKVEKRSSRFVLYVYTEAATHAYEQNMFLGYIIYPILFRVFFSFCLCSYYFYYYISPIGIIEYLQRMLKRCMDIDELNVSSGKE